MIALVFVHLGFPPLIRVSLPAAPAKTWEDERRLAEEADSSACPDGADAYMLTGADPVLSMYAMPGMVLYEPDEAARFRRVRVLSMAPQGQELRVTGDDDFELRVVDEPRRSNLFEHVYRDEPMRPGQVVSVEELTATVLEVEDGLPTKVAFRDSRGLAAACFLVYRDGRLRSMARRHRASRASSRTSSDRWASDSPACAASRPHFDRSSCSLLHRERGWTRRALALAPRRE